MTTSRAILGQVDNKDFLIDVPKLLETRLLVQSNSGGGKSWVLRRLLEQTANQVQQLVIDIEGEFSTLREKLDYVICAPHDADAVAHPRTAVLLARRLMETGVSAILDIYDLKAHERTSFVKLFLESLINMPKSLWHPVIVVIDESHIFCPQVGQAESAGAVIDLATRGRKRGLCAVLATQRLSKLHKDAAAECLNKLIGRTGLDVDVKRAADELGMSPKEAMPILRNLDPGQFFAFGPALSRSVTRVTVGPVQTRHPKVGDRLLAAPPTASDKIKKVLADLADLPKEAEQEARTLAEIRTENANLKRELTLVKKAPPKGPATEIKRIEVPVVGKQAIKGIQEADTSMRKTLKQMRESQAAVEAGLTGYQQNLEKLLIEFRKVQYSKSPAPPTFTVHARQPVAPRTARALSDMAQTAMDAGHLRSGAVRILKELAVRSPAGYSRSQVATLTRFSPGGGTFGTYMSNLRANGFIEERGDLIFVTEMGIHYLGGDIPSLPKSHGEVMAMWRKALRAGAYRMLEVVVESGPSGVHKEGIAEAVGMAPTGGTFGTYLSDLRRNGLIKENNDGFTACDILWPE